MKARRSIRIVLAFSIPIVALGGCKESSDKVKAAIQEQMNKSLAAQQARDSTGFWSVYTDDYTYRAFDGTLYTREQASQGFTESASQMKISADTKHTVDSITVSADTATVVTSLHFVRTQMAADSTEHQVVTDGTFSEVWTKDSGKWKAHYIEELGALTTSVDGTSIPADVGGMRLTRAFWSGGLDSMRVLYMEARAVKQDSIPFQEATLSGLGTSLLAQMRVVDAMHVFEMVTECYPGSVAAWDNLGKAYVSAGQRELASRAFTQALAVDKTDTTAREMLAKLAAP